MQQLRISEYSGRIYRWINDATVAGETKTFKPITADKVAMFFPNASSATIKAITNTLNSNRTVQFAPEPRIDVTDGETLWCFAACRPVLSGDFFEIEESEESEEGEE